MILEGLVCTRSTNGDAHVAPMGPIVASDFARLIFRPFRSSQTCANLQQTKAGVFHVIDDVELLAHAAVGKLTATPAVRPASKINGFVLQDCCRWFEFEVRSIDDRTERVTMECEVVASGNLRPFWGLNRGKHAVVEAAILATRVHLLSSQTIDEEFSRLKPLVEKTGGPSEKRAFAFLEGFVRDHFASQAAPQGNSPATERTAS